MGKIQVFVWLCFPLGLRIEKFSWLYTDPLLLSGFFFFLLCVPLLSQHSRTFFKVNMANNIYRLLLMALKMHQIKWDLRRQSPIRSHDKKPKRQLQMPSSLPPEAIYNRRGTGIQCPKIPFTVKTEDWPRYAHKTVETIFQVCPELHKDTKKSKHGGNSCYGGRLEAQSQCLHTSCGSR